MTILFLTFNKFSAYPVYKRALGVGEQLAKLGCEVYVAVEDNEENRLRMQDEAPLCKPLFFKRGVCSEIVAKLKMLWHIKPDYVYSTSYSVHNLAGLRILFPLRVKTILEFCELYSQYPRKRWNWWLWELLGIIEYKNIVCASNYLLDYFKELSSRLYLRNRYLYSPYAYPEYLNPSNKFQRQGVKKIVFMACMGVGYGVYEVYDAFVKLLKTRTDVVLEMVGGGPEKNNLIKRVEEDKLSEKIIVRGYVPESDLNECFSTADVFVSPIHDTVQDKARCPSKIFYYLPYNKPIVTCNLGNPADVLGEYGYYYIPNDVNSMKEAFNRALNDSQTFTYPLGFIEKHSWSARSKELKEWLKNG